MGTNWIKNFRLINYLITEIGSLNRFLYSLEQKIRFEVAGKTDGLKLLELLKKDSIIIK